MDGCAPSSRFGIAFEGQGTFRRLIDFGVAEAGMLCNANGASIFVRGVEDPALAWPIVRALRVFPKPMLERFLAGASFSVLAVQDFEALPASVDGDSWRRDGVRTVRNQWYVRVDLLDPALKKILAERIWHGVASMLADDLVGEAGFDRGRFQTAFKRYLTKRLGNVLVEPWLAVGFFLSGVDPLYQVYLDRLAESQDFGPQALRSLFREAVADFESSKRPAASTARSGLVQSQPWNLTRFYGQFMDVGFALPITTAQNFTIDLQSAESRERPQSSHRAYFYYSNEIFDGWFSGALTALVPSWKPKVSWTPGIAGSYETPTPNGRERAALIAGSLLDVDLVPGAERWVFHSYLGIPFAVHLGAGGEDASDGSQTVGPEWEIGLRREGALFVGSMLSVPFAAPDRRYVGLVVRWEN